LIFGSGDPAFDSFAEAYQGSHGKIGYMRKNPTLTFSGILVRIQRLLDDPASKALRSFFSPSASLD
jgi:hypothetical protein